MKQKFQTTFFALLLSLLSGCCTYLEDRGNDIQDCFVFNGGVGPGFLVTAKATDFATVRAGWSDVDKIGILGRYAGSWNEYELGIPLLVGKRKIYPDKIDYSVRKRLDEFYAEEGFFIFAAHTVPNAPHDGTGFSIEAKPISHMFDIATGATVGYVSFETGFSIVEFFDFLLGVCGIDILDDDTPPTPKEPKQ